MLMFAAAVLLQVPQIHLSTSAFAAHYGYIRSLQESHSQDADMQAAIEDLDRLDKSLPTVIRTRTGAILSGREKAAPLYWRSIDALTFAAGGMDGFGEIEDLAPRIGGQLSPKDALEPVKKAMLDSQTAFDKVWPAMEREAKDKIAAFNRIPDSKRNAAAEFILKTSAIPRAETVSILVIPKMAGKEGMTVMTNVGPLVVIGADKYEGADFAEVVLHEATHVFDSHSAGSLFAKLRKALIEGKRPAYEIEQVPHVTIFLLAADAVRRCIDPSHKDVGETFGAYSRGLEPLRAAVRPELDRLIDGRTTIVECVAAIVARLQTRSDEVRRLRSR